MPVSPARVLAQYLCDLGRLAQPANATDARWAVVVDKIPTDPDNVVVLMNSGGFEERREHKQGQRTVHPDVQVIIRCLEPPDGFSLGDELMNGVFTKVGLPISRGGFGENVPVLVDDEGYNLRCIKVMVPFTSIGLEQNSNNERRLYSINVQLTLELLTANNYLNYYPLVGP